MESQTVFASLKASSLASELAKLEEHLELKTYTISIVCLDGEFCGPALQRHINMDNYIKIWLLIVLKIITRSNNFSTFKFGFRIFIRWRSLICVKFRSTKSYQRHALQMPKICSYLIINLPVSRSSGSEALRSTHTVPHF